MNCLQFENVLSDYLEGAQTSEQQAHLSSCAACSGLLADLDFISLQARDLQSLEEPSPRVWNGLEVQLRREGLIRNPQPSRPLLPSSLWRWRTAWILPVAAALVIAAGIKLSQPTKIGDTVPVAKQVSQPAPATPPAVSASTSAEDKEILKTVASRPPAQLAAYQADLDQTNAFIHDAQEVLRSNPNDVYSQQLLINAYEQKQMLYHLAVDQSNSNDEQ